MSVPLRYNLLSLVGRRASTLLSVFSIGLSVGVLVLVLSLARGFQLSLVGTGKSDTLILLRKGASSEGESGLTRSVFSAVRSLPGIAVGPDGSPLAAAELYAALNLDKSGGGSANFPLRGVMAETFLTRDSARVAQGRVFHSGTNEVVVGKALIGRIEGCQLGGALELQGVEWPVVGVIDSGGGAYDSEIWCDVEVFMQELDRGVYATISLKQAPGGRGAELLLETVTTDPRIDCKVFTEPEYFEGQAGTLGIALTIVAYFIAIIMAAGAAFGTAVTLLASLARRTREVGTLVALGFRPRSILIGFLCESLALGLAGGVVGVLLALPVNGVATGTMNWDTFTEQAFAFRITPGVVVQAVAFSTLVGVISGVFPAWRASRMPASEALRS